MIELIPNWHPIWVHFAVALLVTGAVSHLIALTRKPRDGMTPHALIVGRWTIWVGVVAAALALLTGTWAAGTVTHDDAGHANMMVHRTWAFWASGIFTVAAVFEWFRRSSAKASVVTVALTMLGAAAIGVTGYEGGQNVYEHGLGVQRLPDVSTHDHNAPGHAHGGSTDAAAASATQEHGHGDAAEQDAGETGGHEHGEPAGHAADDSGGHEHGEPSGHDADDSGGHEHGEPAGHAADEPDGHEHADSSGQDADDSGGHQHGETSVPDAEESDGHDHSAHDHGDAAVSSGLAVDSSSLAEVAAGLSAALVAGDQAIVAQLVHDNVLIFESGNVEISRAEYEGHHMPADMAFLAAMDRELISNQVVELGANGAVVSSRSRLFGHYKDRDIDLISTETLVLKKENDQWRIVHIHWSSNS